MPPALPDPRLVLLTLGSAQDPAGPAQLLPTAAARLSQLSGLPLRPIAADRQAPDALGELRNQRGPWLATLPVDPGLWLPGGSWAEALGAWRQPCLLLIAPAHLATGLPAAGCALLQRWRVPLLGLLQWGGAWEAFSRRRDGLPWLGLLPDDGGPETADGEALGADDEPQACREDQEAALLEALAGRWRKLAAELA